MITAFCIILYNLSEFVDSVPEWLDVRLRVRRRFIHMGQQLLKRQEIIRFSVELFSERTDPHTSNLAIRRRTFASFSDNEEEE